MKRKSFLTISQAVKINQEHKNKSYIHFADNVLLNSHMFTAKNVTDILQVVNFTSLLRLVQQVAANIV